MLLNAAWPWYSLTTNTTAMQSSQLMAIKNSRTKDKQELKHILTKESRWLKAA